MDESDFTTRQHIESLSTSDPSMFEILNRYRHNPTPASSQPISQPAFSGFSGQSSVGHTDALLISNMLGQIQAGIQSNKSSDDGGFKLSINTDVLRWIIVLLLVVILVWLFLKVMHRRKNPIYKRIKNLEQTMKSLKKSPKKKSLPDVSKDEIEEDFEEDFSDDLEDLDDF